MRGPAFTFRGIELPYLDHPYNNAAHNMRSVEVPIVRRYIDKTQQARTLEIGNVLEHYGPRWWPVVDVREQGPSIVNQNVMKWEPVEPYDLIFSISTIEHIGHGKYRGYAAPTTPADVIERVRGWLEPQGVFVATVPMGYNEALDQQVLEETTGADTMWFMRRVNDENEWEECTKEEALAMPFDGRWRWGSGMAVLQAGEFDWEHPTAFWEAGVQMATENRKILNLGCGRVPLKGAINHDIERHSSHVDVVHDLNVLPWPWNDEAFDMVVSRSVFEHLDIDLLASMDETWRILKPDGIAVVKVPYWRHDRCWDDPTHRRGYTIRAFNWFDPTTPEGKKYRFYTPRKWRIVKGPMMNKARTSIHCTLRKVVDGEG